MLKTAIWYDTPMIGQLTGIVSRVDTASAIITVSGIGYKVFVTPPTTATLTSLSLKDASAPVTLEIFHVIREDASDLYGFTSLSDLNMFELLLSLSGVGPKSALSIMTSADTSLITHAVTHNDPQHLSKLSGIGKKTAEKIVLGLKDKLGSVDTGGGASSSGMAIDALLSLGYSADDAREALKSIDPAAPVEEQVRQALRSLARP